MGCVCAKTQYTRHVRDRIHLDDPNNTKLLADSLKRQKSSRLVGEPQHSVTPEDRAAEEFALMQNAKTHHGINYLELKRLLFRMNFASAHNKLRRAAFQECDLDGDGELCLDEFIACFSQLDPRAEMRKLFDMYANNDKLTPQQLHLFFQETAPSDEISGWHPPTLEECHTMLQNGTYPELRALLSNAEQNHVCTPSRLFSVYQDMNQPLSHYYINASHNTYLDGNQTNSNSTPTAIKRALRLGVRVIELDVWDGKTGPIVNHGHTMCRPTSFESCVEAVAECAFEASSFPVILTIENHCTKNYQEMMAKTLHDILGDMLFKFHKEGAKLGREQLYRGPEHWRSPNALQNKVIIRDKPKALFVRKAGESSATEVKLAGRIRAKRGSKLVADEEIKHMMEAPVVAAAAAVQQQPASVRKVSVDLIGRFVQAPSAAAAKLHDASSLKKTKIERRRTELLQEEDEDDEEEHEYDDEDDARFVDDFVENEGLMDVGAAKLNKTRQEMDDRFKTQLNKLRRPSSSAAAAAAAVANTAIIPTRTAPQKSTNSVPQLLEITYIKNLKLRVKEDPVRRRTSLKPLGDGASEFTGIHFTYPPWRSSSSVAEGRMLKLVKPGRRAAGLNTYAMEHLIRCYPAGTRVESTNYDPCPAWNAGIQIVALNFQTNGRSVWLNQGKFADNAACGYVLKPQSMLQAKPCGKDGDMLLSDMLTASQKRYWDLTCGELADKLTLTILSAHWLPKPLGSNVQRSEIIDPFVEVSVSGFEQDNAFVKTKWVKDNGFDPQFGEVFEFDLRKSELDLVMFVVKDKDTYGEDFIAQNAFPANLMRPGYRVVPLKRADSTPLPDAFLFVHVKWERGITVALPPPATTASSGRNFAMISRLSTTDDDTGMVQSQSGIA